MPIDTGENRGFFYLLLAFAALTTYYLLEPYLATIIFSFVVVVMFHPLYEWFVPRVRGRQSLATTLTLITVFLIGLTPLTIVINITISQAISFKEEISTMVAGNNVTLTYALGEVNRLIAKIPFGDIQPITEEKVIETMQGIIQPIARFLADRAVKIGSSSADLITKFIIFLALVSTLFPRYHSLIDLVKRLSPLDDRLDQKYIDRMVAMTKSMVKGVFVIAIAQGVAAGIFYWIAGVKYVFFWTLLAILLSILPLGSHVISVPMAIVLLAMGHIWQGMVLLAGSLIVVGNLDNVLRPRLVSRESELNTALILLSAFGGLNLFGFLGVIYGPVTMIFLVTTLEIYLEHYQMGTPSAKRSKK